MSGDGFLARWSRRKRGEDGPEPDAVAVPLPAAVPPPAPASADPRAPADEPHPAAARLADEPLATETPDEALALPSLEELTRESDVGPFLRPGVPRSLRRAALRRVWTLDPAIRDFVGPADYAWDFNAPDGIPGFSLELGGNVEELLAQAIGAPREPPPAEPPDGSPGIAVREEPGAMAGEAPVQDPAAGLSALPDGERSDEPSSPVALPSRDPLPDAAPSPILAAEARPDAPAAVAPPPPSDPTVPPRRHGTAVPA